MSVFQRVLGIFLCAVLSGCGKHVYYKVKKGDTLYSIGWKYNKDYRRIATWNGIASPYIIHEGEWMRVLPPKSSLKKKSHEQKVPVQAIVTSTVSSSSHQNITSPSPARKKTKILKRSPQHVTKENSRLNGAIRWQWPIKGTLAYNYSQARSGKKGVGILGKKGRNIYSAASGKVVYSGNNFPGYGNLIIIMHNAMYLSAYAYNDMNFVIEGQRVGKGAKIARIGMSSKGRTMLHFEIRKDGVAVDPLKYLPST